ncbi:MAG: type IV pilus assembly protein PilM [Actinobacteria bacterium]|nr:type IV pilus assembly protein PilM [Actinomycetota bacterium]MCL6105308.1 type IV pilus assembly protein PilM [Actinomycetota bacterium]
MAERIIGLDIGTSAVRAVEIDVSGGNRPMLVAFGQVGLPTRSLLDGEIVARTSVENAIKRLWAEGGFSSKTVVVGIGGLRAITRELEMPYISTSELHDAVQFQAADVIPFPPDKTLLSAQAISEFTDPDGNRMLKVLVAAAHSDLITPIVDIVQSAGLKLVGIDLISSALIRALANPNQPQTEAIISVGAGLTVVVIHQQGILLFVRTISKGGNTFTDTIASSLDLPSADAENVKRHLFEENPQVNLARTAIKDTLSDLGSDIRSSINYFTSKSENPQLSRILITGGGSHLYGLVNTISEQFDIPVQITSPMSNLDLSKVPLTPDQLALIDPVMTTPLGLALPEPNPNIKKFNLIPKEVLIRQKDKQILTRVIALVVIILVILLGLSGYREYQITTAQSNVNSLNNQVSTLNAQIARYSKVVQIKAEISRLSGNILPIVNTEINWPLVIKQVSVNMPPGTVLTSFSGTAASLTSVTAKPTTPTPKTILGTLSVSASIVNVKGCPNWIDTMSSILIKGNPLFTNVSVPSCSTTFSSTLDITGVAKSPRLTNYG